jgi:hypothetical protein
MVAQRPRGNLPPAVREIKPTVRPVKCMDTQASSKNTR